LKKGKLIESVEGLRILWDVGAKVHKLKGLKLHAKRMLADGERAIIGSVNEILALDGGPKRKPAGRKH
jgi:cardiolipin synthase